MTTWREAREKLHAGNPRLKEEYDRLELVDALQALKGVLGWEVIAGRGTGSNFTLHLGRKRRRSPPLSNSTLSATAKRFRGEFVLYVQGPWRVSAARRRLATWIDAIERLDVMMAGLRAMKGARVTKVVVRVPEVRLGFDNAATLVIFPDEPEYAADPLFNFLTPGGNWRVLNSGMIERE